MIRHSALVAVSMGALLAAAATSRTESFAGRHGSCSKAPDGASPRSEHAVGAALSAIDGLYGFEAKRACN
jgi:hypothetical protein